MSEYLRYDDIEKWKVHPDCYMEMLQDILNTPDESDIGYFVEVDLKYSDKIKEKTKKIPFCPENKIIPRDKISKHIEDRKPDKNTQNKKLKYDSTDKKKYSIHYRMLKVFVKQGLIDDKVHEIISFEQSKWLEKYISPNGQNRNRAKNDFENDFYNLLKNSIYGGKTMEMFRNRVKTEFIKEDGIENIVRHQPKLTSMVFINIIQFMIVTHSNKTKF